MATRQPTTILPVIVNSQMPAQQRPRRRLRRLSPSQWFKKKATRTASAAANPDNLMRGFAVIQGGAILVGPSVRRVGENYENGVRGWKLFGLGAEELGGIPWGRYFKAAAPSIAAEGAIGTRKLVKKGLSKGFGLFK